MARNVFNENKRKESINNIKCFNAKMELVLYVCS